jgi:hypothetical protein
MMTDREVWLKAMAIVQTHGTMASAPVMDTLLDVLGDDPHWADWARVAAAVDAINDSEPQ